VGRLGSGVWVSASFKIFALTPERNVLDVEGNCPGGGMSGGNISEGKFPIGSVLHT